MSKIKEILCLHHSHLDVGYTHPQSMLLELQCDYIEQVIDLCLKTQNLPEESRFRWTCEATLPVMKWLETAKASRVSLFRKLVKEGYISITAMPMHTTPGCTALQLTQALQQLDHIRKLTGSSITTAINHDVNGQPWTMSSLLLDSNVKFYITGINIHFGGIPFRRPYVFYWDTPDGRSLPVFLGEHYSLFSQFMFTNQGSTAKMHEGVQEYVSRMEAQGWDEDFVYLTATNPPLYDNNCPDAGLADLIRRYNEEGHEQLIRFITPEMLYERILRIQPGKLKHHSGDWTDYWNFGSASTPRELKLNRRAKENLSKADFLSCIKPDLQDTRYTALTQKAYENTVLFDEHTWGSSESVSQPDREDTCAQLNHKKEYAYTAADLSAYLLSKGMEEAAANPFQSDGQEGLLAVNPTAFSLKQELYVPSYMLSGGRTLASLRAKDYLPYQNNGADLTAAGIISMEPFSVKRIPFSALSESPCSGEAFRISDSEIDTPFYRVTLDPATGRIRQIVDKSQNTGLMASDSPWGFFEPVEERIDPQYAAVSRSALFSRDVDKGNKSISQWKHDWKAIREAAQLSEGFRIRQDASCVTLSYVYRSSNLTWLEQKITFSSLHSRISLDVCMLKQPCTDPASLYFALPLSLKEGWEACYDTAGTFVQLDKEQLGAVCRDYITVDKTISVYDDSHGYTLACPDAPMIQVGGFHFGRELHSIPRDADPLLLAWPLNNYWDTNFAASQDGRLSFHYELSPFASFDRVEAYKAGLLASSPLAVGAAIECREASQQIFLHCDSQTAFPIFLRPQYDTEGILIAVKDYSGQENSCTLTFPEKTLSFAAITDIQGNPRKKLSADGNQVIVPVSANAIVYLKLCF